MKKTRRPSPRWMGDDTPFISKQKAGNGNPRMMVRCSESQMTRWKKAAKVSGVSLSRLQRASMDWVCDVIFYDLGYLDEVSDVVEKRLAELRDTGGDAPE